jgi:hypothetical protein
MFMDMNQHALRGPVAHRLSAMGLIKATHNHWRDKEPHTYIGGVDPIDGVRHTPDLEVLALLQLSFHKGVGNHFTILVDITAYSLIGRQEFKVVYPQAQRLNSTNHCAQSKYNRHLEEQMSRHRMVKQLTACKKSINGYPTFNNNCKKMQGLDTQTKEMQRGSEHQCHQMYFTEMEFSELVRHYHLCHRAYQGLLLVLNGTANNISNAFCAASQCGIPQPLQLSKDQCLDGIEACNRQLAALKHQAAGLRKVNLRDCYIHAKAAGDED